jgi:hypothetical protein
MLLLGIGLEHYGEGQARRLSVRPMRPRMAPARQGSGPKGLPQVQEPLLEHASSGEVSDQTRSTIVADKVAFGTNPRFVRKEILGRAYAGAGRTSHICHAVPTISSKTANRKSHWFSNSTVAIGSRMPSGHFAYSGSCGSSPPRYTRELPSHMAISLPAVRSVTIDRGDDAG